VPDVQKRMYTAGHAITAALMALYLRHYTNSAAENCGHKDARKARAYALRWI